jgi:hypothetical protein
MLKKCILLLIFSFPAWTHASVTIEKIQKLASTADNKTTRTNENVGQLMNKFFSDTKCFNSAANEEFQKALKKAGSDPTPSEIKDLIEAHTSIIPAFKTEEKGLQKIIYLYDVLTNTTNDIKSVTNTDAYDRSIVSPAELLDTGENYMVYTLDCSGYLSLVSRASSGAASALAKIAYRGQFESKKSMMIMYGKIIPILNIVINPQSNIPVPIQPEIKLDILHGLLNLLNDSGNLNIQVPSTLTILAYEGNSTATLQGNMKFEASASGSFGLISVEGGSESTASIVQKLNFSKFSTAVIQQGESKNYKIGQIRDQIRSALRSTKTKLDYEGASRETIKITTSLTNHVCGHEWKARILNKGDDEVANNLEVTTQSISNKCIMSITPTGDLLESKTDYKLIIFPVGNIYNWEDGGPAMRTIDIKG